MSPESGRSGPVASSASAAWRVLADDLTGALDTVCMLGAHATVHLGRPDATGSGLAAVATASRDVPAAALPALLRPALGWLGHAGPAYKKVDSLLRGNTFAELAWLQAQRPTRWRRIVFAPAYPAQGRLTHGDRLWVNGPGGGFGGSLRDAFAAHGMQVADGDTLDDCLARAGDGPAVLLPTVRTEGDLQAVARWHTDARSRDWLWAGSAGLAMALGAPQVAPRAHAQTPRPGPLLLVTCSRHPVLREQIAGLCADLPGHVALHDFSEPRPLPGAEADALLQARARALVAAVARPGLVAVVGGDTLLALCRASGARALRAAAGPRAGWGSATLLGGAWNGVVCLSRSGAFGGPRDLVELAGLLAPSATASPLKETTA